MTRIEDENISDFSKTFASLYYKLPNEIQPTEATDMLHYAITFHSSLSFLLMERISKSLQQMFIDAQEIQHNIQAYEHKTVDWNPEHKIDNIIKAS